MRSLGPILSALALFAGTSGVVAAPGENAASLCARTAKDGNVEACRAAVAADRRDLASRENLALAYLSLGDDEDCFQTHAEIVALAPDDGHSHFAYAAALTTFSRYDDAVPFIEPRCDCRPTI